MSWQQKAKYITKEAAPVWEGKKQSLPNETCSLVMTDHWNGETGSEVLMSLFVLLETLKNSPALLLCFVLFGEVKAGWEPWLKRWGREELLGREASWLCMPDVAHPVQNTGSLDFSYNYWMLCTSFKAGLLVSAQEPRKLFFFFFPLGKVL